MPTCARPGRRAGSRSRIAGGPRATSTSWPWSSSSRRPSRTPRPASGRARRRPCRGRVEADVAEAGRCRADVAAERSLAAECRRGRRPCGRDRPLGCGAARAHARATLETIDLHAGGEPIRLIRSGYPRVPSAPILERRRWVREHADGARQMLMYEPRGHRDMYGAVLLPPYRTDADIAVLFMHNEGYSTMCGHGVIALTTGLIEEGLYPATMPATTIRWETPGRAGHGGGGRGARARTAGPRSAASGSPTCPRTSTESDISVSLEGRGPVAVQLAFGGAYYGIVDAADLGLRVVPASIDALDGRRRRHHGEPCAATTSRRIPPKRTWASSTAPSSSTTTPSTAPDGRAADRHDAQRDDLRRRRGRPVAVRLRAPARCSPGCTLPGRLEMGVDIRNASITGEVFEGRVDGLTTPRRTRRGRHERGGHGLRDRLPHVRGRRPRSARGRLPPAVGSGVMGQRSDGT